MNRKLNGHFISLAFVAPFQLHWWCYSGKSAWCLFTRELCKTKTVTVKTLLVNSVYLHGRPQKGKKKRFWNSSWHSLAGSGKLGGNDLTAISIRGGHRRKHLVFREAQTFLIQAKTPLQNSLSKMEHDKVSRMQKTVLSMSDFREIRRQLFTLSWSAECAMPTSGSAFQM